MKWTHFSGPGWFFGHLVLISFFLLFFSVLVRSPLWLAISGIVLIPSALYFAGSPTLWWIAFVPILYIVMPYMLKRRQQKIA
ncbi:hypothetical protein [Alkalihalobacillus sp. AL-G]|uniref:hypothetical protein n=1 Tax=Alkalihalobacillus sp. AL-G TaxID=2926399 RepID=UPI002729834A|nr:hypothetical protein [Alkalihalobacillus sp. AL-G]WLD93762.1 hypothetical protein MOJ78_02260 [Alkalihalobacillus sp. AL-G]